MAASVPSDAEAAELIILGDLTPGVSVSEGLSDNMIMTVIMLLRDDRAGSLAGLDTGAR